MFCVFCKETDVDSSEIIFGRISQLCSSLLVVGRMFSVWLSLFCFSSRKEYVFPSPTL